jgi:hypothetical protein
MELDLREVAYQRKLENRATLRLAKQQEMEKVWEDLFFILAGEEVFKKCPEYRDYASFEKSMRATLEAVRKQPQPPFVSPATDSIGDPFPGEVPPGGSWASLNYTPPEESIELAADFLALQDYYSSPVLRTSLEMILDLSLIKIIRTVSRLLAWAWARADTTLAPVKARKKKVLTRQTDILKAFYSLENSSLKGQTLTGLAAAIGARLISQGIKPPSSKTIIRHLQTDVRTRRNLLEFGVMKDKTGSVQKTTPKLHKRCFCRH